MPQKKKGPTPRKSSDPAPLKGAALILHTMRADEGFDETAEILMKLIHDTQHKSPDAPRHLVFTVEGHRNDEGGYDEDAWELINNFIPGFLSRYLTQYEHPYAAVRMPNPQRNDPPQTVSIVAKDQADKMLAEGKPVFDADSNTLFEPPKE